MNHNTRRNAFQWFLTFPQLGDLRPVDAEHSLELFLDFMLERLPSNTVLMAIVSHEDHAPRKGENDDMEDHGVHIHIVFKLAKKWKCPANMEFFDDLYGKHPNIQTCKRFNAAVVYAGKDGDYATYGIDYEEFCKAVESKKGVKHDTIAKRLISGETVEQLLDHEPGYVLQHNAKIENFIMLLRSLKQTSFRVLVDCVPAAPMPPGEYCANTQVATWIRDTFVTKTNTEKHLYLYGETGIGKSYLVHQLRQFLSIYGIPYDADWFDGFNENRQCAVFEEFNPHYSITHLNTFLDPYEHSLRRRGKTPYVFTGWIPCIFLSNLPPEEVYPKSSKKANGEMTPLFRALCRRLKVVNAAETPIRLNLIEAEAEPEEQEELHMSFSSEDMGDDDLFLED